eukprot:1451980-Amphidinium_carterae.1
MTATSEPTNCEATLAFGDWHAKAKIPCKPDQRSLPPHWFRSTWVVFSVLCGVCAVYCECARMKGVSGKIGTMPWQRWSNDSEHLSRHSDRPYAMFC